MIEVSIATDTTEELAAVLALLNPPAVSVFTMDVCTQSDDAEASDDAPHQEEDTASAQTTEPTVSPENTPGTEAPRKKAGRPRKTEPTGATEQITVPASDTKTVAPEAAQAETAPAQPPVADKAPAPTIDDIRDALSRITETAGLATAKGLLEQFGVKRAGELDPVKYQEFLTASAKVTA